jgi:tetratricopeptide (TPR) repeat protein
VEVLELNEAISLFRFTEKEGPYAVGLKVVEQYDYCRSYRLLTNELGKSQAGERARALQTLIWYPSERSPGNPMTVADYGALLSTEMNFTEPNMPVHAKEWLTAMRPTLAAPLWAVYDAPPATGRFPVVIYAPSFSSMSWENADLCEYFASHGYVVLASPSMGVITRAMTADLAGIDAQATDISFLIGYARTLPNADVSAVAVTGFSWGGISNVFAAARDNRIRALIAFDGSVRYWPGLLARAGDVHPEQMTIPLLCFTKSDWTLEEQARYLNLEQIDGPSVLNAWTHGDLYVVRMLGMTHREFSSMFQRNEDMWRDFLERDFADRQRADYGREHGIEGYAWVARYALKFLDAYLKRDCLAKGFLENAPAQNGVPKHYMDMEYRAACGTAVSLESFRALVGERGFKHAKEIYALLRETKENAVFEEVAINAWAEELLDGGYLDEAITLLELNAEMYPKSSAAYAKLGRAYERSGKNSLAIDCYRKALKTFQFHAEARRRLRDLQST